MRKLTFEFNTPQIEVNGHIFDMKVSDIDILDSALNLAEEFKGLTGEDPKAVVAAIRKCEKVIDSILGDGALKKIADGKPVRLVDAIDVMITVSREAVSAYNEKISDEYDIYA